MTQAELDTATLIRCLSEHLETSKARIASLESKLAADNNLFADLRRCLTVASCDWDLSLADIAARRMQECKTALELRDAGLAALAGLQVELDAKKAENERLRAERDSDLSALSGLYRHLGAEPGDNNLYDLASKRMRERDEAQRERDCERCLRVDAEKSRDAMKVHTEGAEAARFEAERERDAARQMLAKLEWLGSYCRLCNGMKPRVDSCLPSVYGHKPDCWFAKQQTGAAIPADTMKAGATVLVTASFKPDLSAVELTRVRVEQPPVGPKFKPGQEVRVAGFSEYYAKGRIEAAALVDDCWHYTIARLNASRLYGIVESAISGQGPAPKFAVGEWVTWSIDRICGRHESDFAIEARWFDRVWSYRHPDGREVREHEIVAQTPLHKHRFGKECVFLGRYNEVLDLWWRVSDGAIAIDFGNDDSSWHFNGGWVGPRSLPAVDEARRRAKLRGLIK
jgi:hypothetical protein